MDLVPRRQIIRAYDMYTSRKFLTRLDELNKSQWLSRDELEAIQQKKLHNLLTYAHQYVPYYQRIFKEVDFTPDEVLSDMSAIRKLPYINKDVIRNNFDELQTTEPTRRETLTKLTTGGSTGKPLSFFQDNDFRDYVTADLHRHLGWGGWKMGTSHSYIWGTNFEAITSKSTRTKMMDWVLNRFVTNAYVLSDDSMREFADEVRRRRPPITFCYPSALMRFAEFCRAEGYDDIKFDSMFSSAEVLYPGQRAYIEETFGGKMFNRYATRELACISCECEAHTDLHISMENVYMEIEEDGEPVSAGNSGNVIITNLNNKGMPFIRYQVGDMAAWSQHESCSCGRQSQMMELTQGRRIDMFKTRDGRAVWGGFASPLFGMKGVTQFQLVQKTLDLVVARIVRDGELDQEGLDLIERTIKVALGDNVEVQFEFPEEIKLFNSGKYRYAISEVSD